MKGLSELTETFIKLVQIALIILGALAIFFTYVTYEITVYRNDAVREAYILGNALISSPCLTDGTKGLLVQSKINSVGSSDSGNCISYPDFKIEIVSDTAPASIHIDINKGNPTTVVEAKFDILIRMDVNPNTGQIVTGNLTVIKI